ncbi:hypothetical protein, partial [uncultured Desulfovibrio sp.]|uniref:hypothetical protein n=1 Tax=uncultured Desulfovibrio sp. TaxID=167968 RepID=UPI0026146315
IRLHDFHDLFWNYEMTSSYAIMKKQFMSHDVDKIMTLQEGAQALCLDPRMLKEVAFALGGRRIGYRWRFRWGTVFGVFQRCRR